MSYKLVYTDLVEQKEFSMLRLLLIVVLVSGLIGRSQGQDMPDCESSPDAFVAYIEVGAEARGAGEWDTAYEAYNCAVSLQPDSAIAYHGRARAHLARGSYQNALADLDVVLDLIPDDPVAYNNRGRALYRLGYFEESIESFNRAIELDPEYSIAFNNRAISYQALGDTEAAAADFGLAAELGHPDTYLPYRNLVVLYQLEGNLTEALYWADAGVYVAPRDPDAHRLLGDLYLEQSDYDRAEASYERFLALSVGEQSQVLELVQAARLSNTLVRYLPAIVMLIAVFFLVMSWLCRRSRRSDI